MGKGAIGTIRSFGVITDKFSLVLLPSPILVGLESYPIISCPKVSIFPRDLFHLSDICDASCLKAKFDVLDVPQKFLWVVSIEFWCLAAISRGKFREPPICVLLHDRCGLCSLHGLC